MTSATVRGPAIMDRCPAFTSEIWARARLAMKVRAADTAICGHPCWEAFSSPDGTTVVLAREDRLRRTAW